MVIMKEKTAFALEDTLAVYGIRQNPFPIDVTDDFFFSTPMLEKQMEVLRNLLEFGNLLLVVSGVEGAGKTTFLNQFLLSPDDRWQCCRIQARVATTLDTMVDELLGGFGLSARGDDAQSDEALLRAHLEQVHANGGIAMVVVDDAHLLPQICTEFLLGLADERERMELRLLVSSEPGRLGFPTNDAKRVHVVVLQPFDMQQCGDYIHTRLSYAGLGGDSPFDAAAVEAIHQDSDGLPGTIHSLALHTLLANSDTSRLRRGGVNISRTLVYVLVVLAVGVGAAALLWIDSGVEPVATTDSAATGTVRGHITGLAVAPAPAGLPAPGPTDPETPPLPAEPFIGSVTAKAPAEAPGTANVVQVQSGKDAKVFTLNENGVSTRPAVTIESSARGKSATPEQSVPDLRLASNATPAVSTRSESVTAHDLEWLRKQDPTHYVIQLVGTRDLSALGKFLDDHKLGSKGAWFTTSHENKPWYVVVYGMYPDNASARAAIQTLPPALRSGSPWPRSVASVVNSAR